jgi:hypothetical protein
MTEREYMKKDRSKDGKNIKERNKGNEGYDEVLLPCSALSDERTGLQIIFAAVPTSAGPRDSRPYFNVPTVA